MAKQNFPTGNSKGNDSDSWGKLASDLLGIQFGGIDDNFDLPDEVSVPPKVVIQETSQASGSSVPLEEPDLSFSDDEVESSSEEVVVESNVVVDEEPESVSSSSSDSEDDFWGQLENWNWEEPAKPSARSKGESGDRRGGDRSRGHSSSRGGSGEKTTGHDRRSDRGSRKDEPRRTDAPRREEQPRQSESRNEGQITEKPAVQSGEKRENRPPRSSEAKRSHQVNPAAAASVDFDDGFGAGLEDPPSREITEVRAASTTRPAAASSQKKSSPPPARHADDFAGDLFQEVGAAVGDEENESDEKADARGESNSDDRPRRRRRRRRGGRGRRPEGSSQVVENESEANSDIPEGEEDSTEFSEVDSVSAEAVETAGSPAVGDDERDSDSSSRPRRRRRRGRRRSEDREPEVKILEDLPRDEIAGDSADRKSNADTAESSEPEELFTPVNYEGIPTWEEAISYLVRSRNPDPRGRSHGGQRGRSGPSHRR